MSEGTEDTQNHVIIPSCNKNHQELHSISQALFSLLFTYQLWLFFVCVRLVPEGKGSHHVPLSLWKKRTAISACSHLYENQANRGKTYFIPLGRESSQKVSGDQVGITQTSLGKASLFPAACGALIYLRGEWCFQNFLRLRQLDWQPRFHSSSFAEHSKLGLFF